MRKLTSNIYLPSEYSFRYTVFMIFLLLGPSLALMQLKGFHLSVVFLFFVGLFYVVKEKRIDLKQMKLALIFISFVFIWLIVHTLQGRFSVRYVTYLFYFTFTFLSFYFSFRLLITIEKSALCRIIQIFIYVDLLIVLLEVMTNQAFFNYYPMAGSEYQIGSAFWSNMNTNAAVLILLNTSLYFLGAKKSFYLNSLPVMMLSLLVDAKLCFIAAASQVLILQLLANVKARLVFIISLVLLVPVLMFVFQKQLSYVIYTLNQATDFLSNSEALEAIVSSGNMFSVAIRAYALSEMLNIVADFSLMNWLFGIGFGNINISFVNNGWGGLVEYFAPHLFFLEMTIYAGFSYYIFYFTIFRTICGRLPWRSMLMALPSIAAIIAISSAVYFLPFYFFLAVLAYWEYQQQNIEIDNAN